MEEAPASRIIINVLVNNRFESLRRLCASLGSADFMGDTDVTLEFHLEAHQPEEIVRYVTEFPWAHGSKIVHARIVPADPIAAALETWFPASYDEYSVLLDDNMEVSRLFYRQIQDTLESFFQAGAPRNVLGIGLDVPSGTQIEHPTESTKKGGNSLLLWNHSKKERLHFGVVYFPLPWREYLGSVRMKQKAVHESKTKDSRSFILAGGQVNTAGSSWLQLFSSLCHQPSSHDARTLYVAFPSSSAARRGQESFSGEVLSDVRAVDGDRGGATPFALAAVSTARRIIFQSTPTSADQGPQAASATTFPTLASHSSQIPRIIINVLVNNRFESLRRLCASLGSADYMGDTDVTLEFHLEAHQPEEIVRYVTEFPWAHGNKIVHARIARGGLISVVVESWFPVASNEYSLLLEDDIEVSPLFYRYIRGALDSFFRAGAPANVFGISLYTPRVVETRAVSNLPVSHHRFDPQELIWNITDGKMGKNRLALLTLYCCAK
jgi:hypothetical protein